MFKNIYIYYKIKFIKCYNKILSLFIYSNNNLKKQKNIIN